MTVDMQGLRIREKEAEDGHNVVYTLSHLTITVATGVSRIEIILVFFIHER